MDDTWKRTLAFGLAFLLAVGGVVLFAARATRRARELHNASEPIHAWMSIPFIAHTHHVPPALLFQAIGVEPRKPRDRRSVRHLAPELNRPVPEVIAQLQHAIDQARAPGGPAK